MPPRSVRSPARLDALMVVSSAVNVLDLSTEGANAPFFMIDGQDVVLFGILIMETSDKRLW